MRLLRNTAKRGLRDLFEAGQRLGVNVLPRHFYSPIPDIAALRRTRHWRQPFEMHGVAGTDIAGQVAFLRDLCPPWLARQWGELNVHAVADAENGEGGGYGVIEANVLHAFVRRHQPGLIVQVGCGLSTAVILRAAALADYHPEVVCIEPYPSPFLVAAAASGRVRLLAEGGECVPRSTMAGLAAGDLLFVDSTHAVKPGSEVNRIILDVLPRLAAGVFVHFHDIYFPYDYQRGVDSDELFFAVESTLLHAFLVGNTHCRIALSLSMLHYAAPQAIASSIPQYQPQANDDGLSRNDGGHFPSATYLLTR